MKLVLKYSLERYASPAIMLNIMELKLKQCDWMGKNENWNCFRFFLCGLNKNFYGDTGISGGKFRAILIKIYNNFFKAQLSAVKIFQYWSKMTRSKFVMKIFISCSYIAAGYKSNLATISFISFSILLIKFTPSLYCCCCFCIYWICFEEKTLH